MKIDTFYLLLGAVTLIVINLIIHRRKITPCERCGKQTPWRIRFLLMSTESRYRQLCDECYTDYKKYSIKWYKIIFFCMVFVILLTVVVGIFIIIKEQFR